MLTALNLMRSAGLGSSTLGFHSEQPTWSQVRYDLQPMSLMLAFETELAAVFVSMELVLAFDQEMPTMAPLTGCWMLKRTACNKNMLTTNVW